MSSLNLDLTTDQIVAEFYIEGTTGGPAVGNIAVLNLDGNVGNVLRGDGTWGVGGGGGTANVAGSNGQLQYNNAGNLGAITGVTTNGVKLTVNTAANLSVTGGSNGQMLITDGGGNLSFATIPSYVNTPRVELTSPGVYTTNPSWTNASFSYYNNNTAQMNIFINGVLADPDWFVLANTTLTYQGDLRANTAIDILPQAVALSSASPSGNINAFDITCNSITGDGSGLTNIPAGSQISNSTTAVSTLATGNITFVADGSQMMAITDTGIEVNSDFIPASDDVYTLGTPTRRWNHVYIGPNSLTVGSTTVSETTGGGLSIGGEETVTKVNNTITVGNIVADSLTGDASNVSNIQLTSIPDIGNIATVNLDGNVENVMVGDGTFVQFNAAPGSNTQILFNNEGNIDAISNVTIGTNGNITVGSNVVPYIGIRYSNTASTSILAGARARGTRDAPLPVQVGDINFPAIGLFYTGNGAATFDGVAGFTSLSGGLGIAVTAVPSANGMPPSTEVRLLNTVNSNNSSTFATIATNYNATTIRGNLIMSATFGDGSTAKYVPTTATSAGTMGQVAYDSNYIYICTATNTWKRSPLTTW